jgi:hypothetical protein
MINRPPLVNTRTKAITILSKMREQLVEGLKRVAKRGRQRPSEKAMMMMSYQQDIEAITLAIMALEQQPEEQGNGHQATN